MAKSKKKYYAVARGQVPGIYETWAGAGGAQAQVQGYPGARYKGFGSLAEAQAWIDGGGFTAKKPVNKTVKKDAGSGETDIDTALKEGKIVMYTDGGALNNPGPGGYGVVIISGNDRKELTGGFRRTTNNRMELTACIEGLKSLEPSNPIILYTDSKYVVNGITKGWARRWRANGWLKSNKTSAENVDLWKQLLDVCETLDVEFRWVRGHAGNEGNERCDQLARQSSADTANFKIDHPFETGKTQAAGSLFSL